MLLPPLLRLKQEQYSLGKEKHFNNIGIWQLTACHGEMEKVHNLSLMTEEMQLYCAFMVLIRKDYIKKQEF
jgi:hypothetical protein